MGTKSSSHGPSDPAGHDLPTASDSAWEAAYCRFETPEQETRKFTRRLQRAGAQSWQRDWRIVELFCGRGNGLVALERLGFQRLSGVDLSPRLLSQYRGSATCRVADCRELPFEDASKDVAIVQGGLHHLPTLPHDLERVLDEVLRILTPDGLLFVVEPWSTPFLTLVHAACRSSSLCRLSGRLNALATMIAHERDTYDQWLARPAEILSCLRARFMPLRTHRGFGKLTFLGRPWEQRHAA